MTRAPRWERPASELLRTGERHARLIGAMTPVDYGAEVERTVRAWLRGHRTCPRFHYGPQSATPLEAELATLSRSLRARGELARLYAERADELALELALGRAVGTPAIRGLAHRRFVEPVDRGTPDAHAPADELAARWAHRPDARAEEPASVDLRAAMTAEVEALGLPWKVTAVAGMAALAAVGASTVYVRAGAILAPRHAGRVVVHEIHGHVLPRWRARRCAIGLAAIGTARGADEQEGYALVLEEERSLLDASRQVDLALRHVAARRVHQGADFFETTDTLLALGTPVETAVRVAARAHRGGNGREGGIGREIVYLTSFVRVRALRLASPERMALLGRATAHVGALDALAPWLEGGGHPVPGPRGSQSPCPARDGASDRTRQRPARPPPPDAGTIANLSGGCRAG